MGTKKGTFKAARKAGDGRFMTMSVALRHKGTTVVETMKKRK